MSLAAQDTPDKAIPDSPDISKLADIVNWTGVAASIVVIVAAMVALRFLTKLADGLTKRFAARRLSIQKAEQVVRFVVYFATAGLVISLSFRIDRTALTVVGGALAFAVGFAMRDLVAAIIAGVMIMFDRPFQVGDRVEYAGQYGDIIQIGLRSVRMRTLNHDVVTIPNNKILTDVTSSGNYGEVSMRVTIDVYIGVDQDAELAERLVRESIVTSRYVYLGEPVAVTIGQILKEEMVVLRVRGRAYVLDTRYESEFKSDVNKRVLRAFQKHDVRPPAMVARLEAAAPAQPPG